MKKERYIPEDCTDKRENKEANAVVYISHENCRAIAFSGRKSKSDFFYRFNSKEAMEKHIEDYFKKQKEWQDYKRKSKEWKHTLKTGVILYSSWGYEQTNINFYQVIEVVGKKTVVVREIAQEKINTGNMSGVTSAKKDELIGEPLKRRVKINNNVRISDCQLAEPWNGKPMCYSSYH